MALMKSQVLKLLKNSLKEKDIKINDKEIEKYLEVPPSIEMGDFAFPCFFLSKKLKANPNKIAEKIKKNLVSKNLKLKFLELI